MSEPRERPDEEAVRRRAESRAADRDRWLDLLRTGTLCLMWSAIGILAILWSAHTTSVSWGRIAFFGGVLVGNAGIIFTLLAAWRRGEQRGDW